MPFTCEEKNEEGRREIGYRIKYWGLPDQQDAQRLRRTQMMMEIAGDYAVLKKFVQDLRSAGGCWQAPEGALRAAVAQIEERFTVDGVPAGNPAHVQGELF